ncbi:anthranilate synthase component I [Candidatus Margulisiibacteriota bacterium]
MFYPSEKDFIQLAKQGNLIPVYKEIVADLETPVSAYLKIETADSFLLESVEQGENIARWSFIGSKPFLKFKAKKDPYLELKKLMQKYKPVTYGGLPPFHGGAVGYFSYDSVRCIENIPCKNKDDLKFPLAQFLLTDTVLVFDHVKHKILVISNALIKNDPKKAYAKAKKKIDNLIQKLKRPLPAKKILETTGTIDSKKISSNFEPEGFHNIVRKAKEYIKAGDIFQVVLSQRFEKEYKGDPFKIYRQLRSINPSPYMFYLKFGKTRVIGSSPEILVRLEGRKATVRPIAGTRRRGRTPPEDLALEKDLLSDKKELAEHIMLVDLGRNDLGRVCYPGSVKTNELKSIERYSHVMHIVSNVEGRLLDYKDGFDLLKATFPAGTVSGAPKIRAMEIIDELEPARRGLYAGSVGYFDFSGNLDSCITIRTIIVKDNRAYVQSGAGIVADSDPRREYEETINKAMAMLKCLGE